MIMKVSYSLIDKIISMDWDECINYEIEDKETFGFISDFIKNGNQFVYVRRYKTEFKDIYNFFDDIINKYGQDGHVHDVVPVGMLEQVGEQAANGVDELSQLNHSRHLPTSSPHAMIPFQQIL